MELCRYRFRTFISPVRSNELTCCFLHRSRRMTDPNGREYFLYHLCLQCELKVVVI